MNKLLGVDRTLDLLSRLQNSLQSYAGQIQKLDQECDRDLARLERQHRHARQQWAAEDDANRAQAQAAYDAGKAGIEARAEQRKTRIARARASVQARRLGAIANDESRQVFQIQRELLQSGRDRDAAIREADARQAAFLEQWNLLAEQLQALDQRAHAAFRGYSRFRHKLWHLAPDFNVPNLATDADEALQQAHALAQQAGEHLDGFRRLLLPKIFSLAPLGSILLLLLVVYAAAVPLLRMFEGPPLTWAHAAMACAAFVVITVGLFFWSRRRAAPAAERVIRAIHLARQAHDAAHHAADARHQGVHAHSGQNNQSRTVELERDWNNVIQAAVQERRRVEQFLGTKTDRALASQDQQRISALTRLEAEFQDRMNQLDCKGQSGLALLQFEHEANRKLIEERRETERKKSNAELEAVIRPAFDLLEESRQAAEEKFPPWTAPGWRDWVPPAGSVTAAPFGRIEMDLAPSSSGGGSEVLARLSYPSRLQVPLLLTLPDRGSIWLETRGSGRETALASLNNLVLRLLADTRPGRIAFTILDPVGLGQNFAGLMHLADHADRLINRRIWTQPEQIEQQLGDLNEHIEKVTQLYLRNEYQTIAEYNQEADRVAEPYHFLVIADFPAGFADLAFRRLLSILSSGPRCGVFTLIHCDGRKPVPAEFSRAELPLAGVWLESDGHGFGFRHPTPPGVTVQLDPPPDAALTTDLLQNIGRSTIDAYRVELPFGQIAPDTGTFWTADTTAEVRVAIGITGATKLQHLALGKGTRQHALIAGKTGSGKSTLFHVLITNLALWAGPDQVEFYLVDFKKGVEFKCYATHRLPHARVVAIESDREFALSVLQCLDDELRKRGDLFRQLGVQDLPGYQREGGARKLPRCLLIIDEFQEFFTEDDRIAQNAALLLDRLVRQGRAFGIHVLLGSQTLGGAYTLARTTLGQMTIRIALQCNQADAQLIMDDDNAAPRLLSRPGEAIYNDAAGALEGNHPFQVAWLSDDQRDHQLRLVREHTDRVAPGSPAPVVFEGNAPANVRENPVLSGLLAATTFQPMIPPRIWLGAPNSIKGPTEVQLRPQSGNNLLVVGLYEETILALLGIAIVSLAAQHRRDAARFVVLDASPKDSDQRRFLDRLVGIIPQPALLVGPAELNDTMKELADELERRGAPGAAVSSTYLFVHQLPRFKGLRYEDEFSISLDPAGTSPGQQLNRILSEGPPVGLHVLGSCDNFNNATRYLGRKALGEFELRVLFQMSASDSASLADNPKAASLGLHRALLHNAQEGSLETFRPYALPDREWIDRAGEALSRLLG